MEQIGFAQEVQTQQVLKHNMSSIKKIYKVVDGKVVEVQPEKNKLQTKIKVKGPGLNWSYKSGSKV